MAVTVSLIGRRFWKERTLPSESTEPAPGPVAVMVSVVERPALEVERVVPAAAVELQAIRRDRVAAREVDRQGVVARTAEEIEGDRLSPGRNVSG